MHAQMRDFRNRYQGLSLQEWGTAVRNELDRERRKRDLGRAATAYREELAEELVRVEGLLKSGVTER